MKFANYWINFWNSSRNIGHEV